MKLSRREIDLVANISQLHKRKIKGLVGILIVLAIYWALRYAGVLHVIDIPFDSLMLLVVAYYIGSTFSRIRPEDRYLELLRKYVDNDADAMVALSERKLPKS